MALASTIPLTGRSHHDDDRWGSAIFFSVAGHALLSLLFIMSGPVKPPTEGTVLTEVNFVEKPVESPAPTPGAPEPSLGMPESVPQAPDAGPASPVLAFSGPAQPAASAQPVNAPIISNAPIMPLGAVGAVGTKKAALAPLPIQADASTVKKGPVAMPMTGAGKGTPLAMNTQGVEDVRRRGGGPVIPLLTQGGGGGGGGAPGTGKALSPVGGTLSTARKPPIEALKANPVAKDAWGQKNSPFSMEGPLKYRKIKSMQMPPYPRWAEEQGVEASVSYRVTVDAKGKVKPDMYLEKTSGYTELDALAKEALLKFIFVPLPDNAPPEDEWGVATFRFELKK